MLSEARHAVRARATKPVRRIVQRARAQATCYFKSGCSKDTAISFKLSLQLKTIVSQPHNSLQTSTDIISQHPRQPAGIRALTTPPNIIYFKKLSYLICVE